MCSIVLGKCAWNCAWRGRANLEWQQSRFVRSCPFRVIFRVNNTISPMPRAPMQCGRRAAQRPGVGCTKVTRATLLSLVFVVARFKGSRSGQPCESDLQLKIKIKSISKIRNQKSRCPNTATVVTTATTVLYTRYADSRLLCQFSTHLHRQLPRHWRSLRPLAILWPYTATRPPPTLARRHPQQNTGWPHTSTSSRHSMASTAAAHSSRPRRTRRTTSRWLAPQRSPCSRPASPPHPLLTPLRRSM